MHNTPFHLVEMLHHICVPGPYLDGTRAIFVPLQHPIFELECPFLMSLPPFGQKVLKIPWQGLYCERQYGQSVVVQEEFEVDDR